MKRIFRLFGFIKVRGKWMHVLYARMLMKAIELNTAPEAWEIYQEIMKQLQKEK